MLTWILIVALYAVGMGLFHVLGGVYAAGEGIESWGRAHAAGRREQLSS